MASSQEVPVQSGASQKMAVVIDDYLVQTVANTTKIARFVLKAPRARYLIVNRVFLIASEPSAAAGTRYALTRVAVGPGDLVAIMTALPAPLLAPGMLAYNCVHKCWDAGDSVTFISNPLGTDRMCNRVLEPDMDGSFSVTVGVQSENCNAVQLAKFLIEGTLYK